jgi:poly(3-hydroxybutyrate) depolymerase
MSSPRPVPTLLLLAALSGVQAGAAAAGGTVSRRLEVDGRTRTYLLHVPAALSRGRPAPVVLVFHGGGANAEGTEHMTGFSSLADREGFLVAYPEGVGRNWNDGREIPGSTAHREKLDDVGFVTALIDTISREHAVDPLRVYATGMSNGGIFSHYLAARLSERIAAIAPVVGGMAEGPPFDLRPRATRLRPHPTGNGRSAGSVRRRRRPGRATWTDHAGLRKPSGSGSRRTAAPAKPPSTICPIPTLPMAAERGASFTRVAATEAR